MNSAFQEESGILISRINTLDQLKKNFFEYKMATILKYKHFFLKDYEDEIVLFKIQPAQYLQNLSRQFCSKERKILKKKKKTLQKKRIAVYEAFAKTEY